MKNKYMHFNHDNKQVNNKHKTQILIIKQLC